MKYLIIIGLFVPLTFTAFTQDFDRDSIYYTPIEKNLTKNNTQQQKPSDKNYYFFNFLSGTLIGSSGMNDKGLATFSFSTTHGVRLGNRLSVGAGVGFDSYLEWKAVPLFGSLSYDLLGKKNKICRYPRIQLPAYFLINY